ncbi:NAD(P)-binding protein [Mytilinidion resinicola]|uniref:NAD(P)-binding protein n=1 Tax=Mytilinidion resinicola TaxID=574789 RepID=A0A6A6YET5_9PEZI|nr:NAD(P)-binding protein [Mytilinidion resinicola]KAF2807342.1 NAD(P)-binding protein [Mytilinidion resinicola]
MAQAVKRRLVVCGGNGFLGSRICKAATARGWQVTSISRSGEPTWSSVTSSPNPPPWAQAVSWQKGDILNPSSYTSHLEGADAVVHSMGILLEADYKGVLQGRESIVSGLQRAFSSTKGGSQNPLERKEGEPLKPQERDGQLTYELMNRDSAIGLAKEASAHKVPSFLYISAAGGAPILPGRYIASKREAEATIAAAFPSMRSIFIRAPFLYDSSRGFTVPMAAITGMGAMANSLVGGKLTWLMGAGGVKPLKADTVGEACVEALGDSAIKGPVEVKEIEALGTKAWRKGML